MLKIIEGMRFGKLTVKEKTDKRYQGNCVIWECQCDCGKIVEVDSHRLRSGNTTSCGCKIGESVSKRIKKHIEETYVDGTRIDLISSDKTYKNNKSGVKGLFKNKKGDYVVTINFKKQRYYLGTFSDKEKAIEIRKEAEEKLYGNFLEWYNALHKKENKNEAK
jgi:hypothetical protein